MACWLYWRWLIHCIHRSSIIEHHRNFVTSGKMRTKPKLNEHLKREGQQKISTNEYQQKITKYQHKYQHLSTNIVEYKDTQRKVCKVKKAITFKQNVSSICDLYQCRFSWNISTMLYTCSLLLNKHTQFSSTPSCGDHVVNFILFLGPQVHLRHELFTLADFWPNFFYPKVRKSTFSTFHDKVRKSTFIPTFST